MSNPSTDMGDTPTHRMHQQQLDMRRIQEWVLRVRTNRALVVEKVSKAKAAASKVASSKERNSVLRALTKIERLLTSAEVDIDEAVELFNAARVGIFSVTGAAEPELELSNAATTDEGRRGTTEGSATRPALDPHCGGAAGAVEGVQGATASASDEPQSTHDHA